MEIEGIIGKKLGMTQIFTEDGTVVPVTVIQAGPCYVIQKKETTVQLGFEPQKVQRVTKPMQGHFKKAGRGCFKYLKEFKVKSIDEFNLGDEIKVTDIFKVGEFLHVTGRSKGRGFTGVMKRWNFAGGRDSHGAKQVHRHGGSIGMSADPGRVLKGKKMPGHYGNEKVTVKNLQVMDIKPEENLILVKGAVPGHINGIVYLRKQYF